MRIKTNCANAPVWKEVTVKSRIPESLKMLEEMARNIWWSWNDEAIEMFKELDPELWSVVGQNPVALFRHNPLLKRFSVMHLRSPSPPPVARPCSGRTRRRIRCPP